MSNTGSSDRKAGGITRAQWAYITLVVALTTASLLYNKLFHGPFGHTALMFLGIPAVLAILLALTPKAISVTGGILKGITLALLIAAPLLGEGYVCILFASPLFYVVGLIVGLAVDASKRGRRTTLSCVTVLILPMCLEGAIPGLTFHRTQTVQVTRIVAASPRAVEEALSNSPRVDTPLPAFLQIGFPRPLSARGDGLAPGDLRTIHFAGAEGDPPGDLVMRVTRRESNPRSGSVHFETIGDSSKLTQWLRWDSSDVQWKQLDPQHTSVTWQIHFERQLDPAWYFTLWERLAVHDAALYLIQSNATPQPNAH